MRLAILGVVAFLALADAGTLLSERHNPVNWKDLTPDYVNDDERIIGGELATPGQFPYQVALIIDGGVFCGGSLISDLWVLTAAHCASGRTTFDVWMGTTKRSANEPQRVIMTTTDKIVHQLYLVTLHNRNDIALLQLPQTPIRLPRLADVDTTYVGTMGIVSGWGRTDESVPGAVDDLGFVDLTVVDRTVCEAHYGWSEDTQLCLSVDEGKGSCSGDSGGPYVYNEPIDGQLTQIGMVSYGSSAGCVGGPKGFMRIAYFLNA
ncbi:hypothetical protein B566_EDAN000834 [Ephemera danica]|nr:hypothetical protein B566_EDAN000834 [Ephemera danica]